MGLLPLLYGDLRRPWSEKVFCSDASPEGFGVCQTELPLEQVQSIGRWQETWRFRHLDPSEWRPRQRASGLDVIRDVDSVRAGCCEESPEDLYSYNGNFPEVPQDILQPERWSTQLMGKWGNTATHITAKEGDALVLVARHIVRSSASRGKRHLVLVDSFSISMMSCKGRASNFGLLRTAQKLAALSLGGNLSIRTRWIRSEDNVSDGPSIGGKSRRVLSSNQGTMVWAKPKTCRVLTGVRSVSSRVQLGQVKKQRQIPCQKNKEEILKPQTVRKRNLSRSSTAAPKPVKRRIISKTDGVTDHACKLAKSHGLTSLERRSVSRGVEPQYAEYYQR